MIYVKWVDSVGEKRLFQFREPVEGDTFGGWDAKMVLEKMRNGISFEGYAESSDDAQRWMGES